MLSELVLIIPLLNNKIKTFYVVNILSFKIILMCFL